MTKHCTALTFTEVKQSGVVGSQMGNIQVLNLISFLISTRVDLLYDMALKYKNAKVVYLNKWTGKLFCKIKTLEQQKCYYLNP